MNEAEIKSYLSQDLVGVLKESGISLRILMSKSPSPDIILELKYEGDSIKLLGEICSSLHFSHFYQKIEGLKKLSHQKPCRYPILIAPNLSPEKQSICKKAGIFYLDLSGNMFVRLKNLLIDRQGKHKVSQLKQISKNPFSDKASLLLRILLEKPAQSMGIRELAGKAGVNPGWVSQVAQKLEELDYIVRVEANKVKLVRVQQLIGDWVEFYKYKKKDLHQYYCHAKDGVGIIEDLIKIKIPQKLGYALSVQGGAYLVSPHAVFQEVHLYLPGSPEERIDAVSFWKKALKLEKVERGGNFFLMEPYYRYSVFYGKREVKGLNVVSDIQLYLDLKRYPLRGEEQAEHLFSERIRPLLEKR